MTHYHITPDMIEHVRQSYGRCCMTPAFFDRFYDSFLEQSDSIPEKFVHTDMTKQKQLLRESISFMLMFADHQPMARTKMEELRISHSRGGHDIKPEMYLYWVDALIKTLNETDPDWTAELEADWLKVIKPGIEYMKAGY